MSFLSIEPIYLQHTFIKTCRARSEFLRPLTYSAAHGGMTPWKGPKQALKGGLGPCGRECQVVEGKGCCPGLTDSSTRERYGQSRAKWNILNEGPRSRGRTEYLCNLTERHKRLIYHSFLLSPQLITYVRQSIRRKFVHN